MQATDKDRDRDRDRESARVCMCVCVRERETDIAHLWIWTEDGLKLLLEGEFEQRLLLFIYTLHSTGMQVNFSRGNPLLW